MMETIPLIPDQFYHIYNRGNNKENLFKEEKNYQFFLEKYQFYINPVAETYAYCLMRNHFHLLIKMKSEHELLNINAIGVSKNSNILVDKYLSQQFSNLFNSYAKTINKTYERTGTLFESRFRRKLIDSSDYLLSLIHYIHYNPQKHGFVEDFRKYKYSSYSTFLSDKPTNINRDFVFDWFQGKNEFVEFHKKIVNEKVILDLIDGDLD